MKKSITTSILILSFLMFFALSGTVLASDNYTVKAVQYSPNAQNLAIGDNDGDVCIYQVNAVRIPFPYEPEGRKGGGSGGSSPGYTIHIDKSILQRMHGHSGAINSITYASNGLSIASAGADKNIVIWDPLSGDKISTLTGHTAAVLALAYNPDNNILASGSADGTIRVWDVKKATCIQTIKGEDGVSIFSLSFTNDGKYLISGNSRNYAVVWSATNLNLPLQPIYKIACGDTITAITTTPSNTKIVVASMDGKLTLFDLATGKEIKTIQAHTPGFQSVAFSVDGSFFASAGTDKKIQLVSVADASILRTIKTSADTIYSLSFEPTGDIYLAAGTNDGAHIYNTASGDQLAKLAEGDKKQ